MKAATTTCAFLTLATPRNRRAYKALGVSNYNALQTHVEKRLSHGVQVGFSYTWSHALDEQSAMGLFYNGNNPDNPHGAYASSDFDRTHVLNFNYLYQFPSFVKGNSLAGKIANGWAIQGIAVIESGQPYSVIDYTGAVGSIFYGVTDGIINPDRSTCSRLYHPQCGDRRLRERAPRRRSRRLASPCPCFNPAT